MHSLGQPPGVCSKAVNQNMSRSGSPFPADCIQKNRLSLSKQSVCIFQFISQKSCKDLCKVSYGNLWMLLSVSERNTKHRSDNSSPDLSQDVSHLTHYGCWPVPDSHRTSVSYPVFCSNHKKKHRLFSLSYHSTE